MEGFGGGDSWASFSPVQAALNGCVDITSEIKGNSEFCHDTAQKAH